VNLSAPPQALEPYLRQRSKTKPPGTQAANQLRIIAGKHRGRKLSFADLPGLRPSGDRLRETLFNWLAPHIVGAHCLDLYTGSGALALEAVSREASSVIALDKAPEVINTLRQHANTLNAMELALHQADANIWLGEPADQACDIVFIDPPFDHNLWQTTIDLLGQGAWLADGAVVYIESRRDSQYTVPAHWHLHREKKAGQVLARLYHCT